MIAGMLRTATTACAVLAALVGSIGCAAARPSPTVIRVGDLSIGKRAIEHWTSLIENGAIIPNIAGPVRESPRRQAIELLVAVDWLRSEASQRDLRLSPVRLSRLVDEQSSLFGARGEVRSALGSSNVTSADIELQVMARWAASRLAQLLAGQAADRARREVTGRSITRFYRTHIKRYHLRERRHYDLIEGIGSRTRAEALALRLGTGERFSRRASKEFPFRPIGFANLPGQATVYRAVFSAKVGELVGPLPLQGRWALFVLRRVDPARVQPLQEARGSIAQQLYDRARRRAMAQLIEGFRRKWIAKTDCRPGYLVQKCKQYEGPRSRERTPFAGF